ncbi:neuroendocrine convertase 1 [Anaeramoeba flamelloides]|uniref:Neuroendocrine convertase 1 n=1 Tax=Anaeramoeba flamelloides TaxID=1746091 RepID=A0ABQ8Y4K2_9EUKA|nr:neuroendocrine convertase 1 [Anaeramoeba flamelloides]
MYKSFLFITVFLLFFQVFSSQPVLGPRVEGQFIIRIGFDLDPFEIAESVGCTISAKSKSNLKKHYYLFSETTPGSADLEKIKEIDPKFVYNHVLNIHKKSNFNPVGEDYEVSDPLFEDQFHLLNTEQFSGRNGIDVNVEDVWNQGYFAEGILISVVDDGLLKSHKDFSSKFHAGYSYDYCRDIDDPSPPTIGDDHGTACAGVCCASDNDGACGVGSAPKSTVIGRRVICDGATIWDYANSLRDDCENIHISTNSWGPLGCTETSCSFESSTSIEKEAVADCIEIGRGGKGTVYLFAAGNEREYLGDSNQYELNSSPHVITVAALNIAGTYSFYSNTGASLLVTAPSSGKNADGQYVGISTTGMSSDTKCRSDFGGTSSATPLVAGVVGLIIESNPDLSYLDIQGILIESARQLVKEDPGWVKNAADYYFSHDYGYGLVNAKQAVLIAEDWESLTPIKNYIGITVNVGEQIPDNDEDGLMRQITMSTADQDLTIVSGVVVYLSIDHQSMGDLEIYLESPSGAKAKLASPIPTLKTTSIEEYPFVAKNFYGVNATGDWKIYVIDTVSGTVGTWIDYKFEFYGIEPRDLTKVAYDDSLPDPLDDDEEDDKDSIDYQQLLMYFGIGAGVLVVFGVISCIFSGKKKRNRRRKQEENINGTDFY